MLLDTSGLMCLFDADDFRHAAACNLYDTATARLTHNYVLAEFVALAHARRAPRAAALDFALSLEEDPEVEMVWVDQELHRDAFILLRARLDKGWSLRDAVSIVLMQERQLAAALTTDHHFEQAGLQRLLPR